MMKPAHQTTSPLAILGCLALLAALAGCKAKPAPDSGFLDDPAKLTHDPNSPFARAWWNPAVNQQKYTRLYVAPVNTQYVMAQNLWERASEAQLSDADIRKSIESMGTYMHDAFKNAADRDPKHRLKVVDEPSGPDTLVLEMAIVQLVPSKAVLNALGFVTWIPAAVAIFGSTVTQSEDQGKGVIAFEARMRDGATGEVVGMFADREHPPTALVDIKALNWWAPAKTVVDAWAKQFVDVLNNPGKKVPGSNAFELLVW